MQYKFTVQRVNEASFFEVTTSRSCKDINGFHNVMFSPGGKAIISCSVSKWVRFLVSTFESFLGFQEFSPRLSAIFFKRALELHHVVYEVWLDSYLFFSFQIWYFWKWIITSIGQSKHMRVTRFNPLRVSGLYSTKMQLWAP